MNICPAAEFLNNCCPVLLKKRELINRLLLFCQDWSSWCLFFTGWICVSLLTQRKVNHDLRSLLIIGKSPGWDCSSELLHALHCCQFCARSTKLHNGKGQMGDAAKEKWKGWESQQQNVRIGEDPPNCIAFIYITRHDFYDVFKSGAS